MQPTKSIVRPTKPSPGKVSESKDDIYDIPTSRETTPTLPEKRSSQTGIRTGSDNSGKKRKQASAFTGTSATKRQQSSRPHAKHGSSPKVAPKATMNPSANPLPEKDIQYDSQVKGIALPPSAPIRSAKNSDLLTKSEPTPSTTPELNTARPRRQRLIDTLVAQRSKSPESVIGSDSDSKSDSGAESIFSKAPMVHTLEETTYNSPSPQIRLPAARTPDRRGGPAKNRKIKLTYSSSRSFLGGSQSQANSAILDNVGERLPVSDEEDPLAAPISPPVADYDFEDESDGPKVGIQSVHELRRAGANNRFSDEMDDLLARIGKPSPVPSTLRRNALCELANKLQRKEFASQFRDHAARDNIVKAIGSEEDIISGFALVAALVTFLSFSPAPHLLRQLPAENVGALLSRLFRVQRDVDDISMQKDINLTRATKSSFKSLKSSMLQMDIWHEQRLTSLTPRTLALQLLVVLSRYADTQCLERLTPDIEHNIASMAQTYSNESPPRHIDYVLIILALEAQSNVMSLENEKYTVAIKGCLQATLDAWLQQNDSLNGTTLKLAINMTNSGIGASVFDDSSILSKLMYSISQGLTQIQSTLHQGSFQNKLYDELLLILGIVINILEHCAAARTSVDGRSLDEATALWLRNMSFVDHADSVSKSKIGVALGYLAIVLGYLYLTPSGRLQMRAHQDWPGTAHLVNSIQEFLRISQTIGNKTHELETLVGDLRVRHVADG